MIQETYSPYFRNPIIVIIQNGSNNNTKNYSFQLLRYQTLQLLINRIQNYKSKNKRNIILWLTTKKFRFTLKCQTSGIKINSIVKENLYLRR